MTSAAAPGDVDGAAAGGSGTTLRIWGAGGSAPTGRAARMRLGGDTVCFEIRRAGETPLVIDMGSGARDLGQALAAEAAAEGRRVDVEVLLSHLHLDHVVGLPFFSPLYDPESHVTFRSAAFGTGDELERALNAIASPPIFPVRPLDCGAARFRAFEPDAAFELCGCRIVSIPLFHPGGCTGFRVETPDGVICVIGDHEHGDPEVDAAVAKAVAGAEVMLYDATYDDCEYEAYRGWGHSTWQKGVELADAAGVGAALLHHHQPEHDDDVLEAREEQIRARCARAMLARQGQVVTLSDGAIAIS